MTPNAKTIQIFLPDGDPRGIRIAEITTRIVQVIEVPRSLLQDFLKMPESGQVGLYFLVGGESGEQPLVYVGQTGELRKRLSQHNNDSKKDFWERALILISRTNSLTQTHGLFLEWLSLQEIRKAERYSDENGNGGSKPHTPAPLEAECLEIFDTARSLLGTLGYPLFTPLVTPESGSESEQKFYCKGPGTEGVGIYNTEGFVVLKGSKGRRSSVKSIKDTSTEKWREKIIASDVVEVDGDSLTFTKDHLFASPSAAAIALKGRSANGWIEWKTEDGKTLDDVKRQSQQPKELINA
ncbi:GIY-YIG nuclease family protein [Sulfuriroseicoccus oceanibius]|uniref:GIY-YIG nuclease family protein n=1 Tax=Sulfuriroseicoccus oceanibius TaxID=2707525 RepID=A0A6B3L8F2_9BACT|nr:GIY-YIG nuclease family protein [Sulfuriroseicoccus oceanibius]QQL43715.1 GIY-YIG nuclease family protein [Sulfuriroseicoccus oceanibius]